MAGPPAIPSPPIAVALALTLGMMQLVGAVVSEAAEAGCAKADAGITLPKGFCATVLADKVGHARQMAVAPNGTVYVNTWLSLIHI